MVDSNLFSESLPAIASPARSRIPPIADWMTFPARFARAPLRTVKPPFPASSALSPASPTASPSLPAPPPASPMEFPRPSADADALSIWESSPLISALVLLMSVAALLICVRMRDMVPAFDSWALELLSTSLPSFATASLCLRYSGDVSPSSRPMRSSFSCSSP